ncbi:hypothetical protein L083_5851 [Actinoplanes sp. N902-109]|nr:hypothetical protein L083_5851 [Actinoplanes sp. N902-109]
MPLPGLVHLRLVLEDVGELGAQRAGGALPPGAGWLGGEAAGVRQQRAHGEVTGRRAGQVLVEGVAQGEPAGGAQPQHQDYRGRPVTRGCPAR